MGLFDFFNRTTTTLKPEQLQSLVKILDEGQSNNMDFSEFSNKIKKVLGDNSGTIKVVLLGSFSDGKTSVVAGLLGQVLSNMKIDQDESSDELEFYKPLQSEEAKYEFIDTPGLFGTKEKETNDRDVRFSDITLKYISEAHIIMYVCDAVTPIKDSHIEIIRRILRDYNKLKNTIFIVNRFDETGCEMSDQDEYNKKAVIKRSAVIQRLKDSIGLTSDEESLLKIACVAANPNNRGMDYWLKRSDYDSYSHISEVKKLVEQITDGADKKQLLVETNYSVMKDVTTQIQAALDSSIIPLQNAVTQTEGLIESCEMECKSLKRDLVLNLGNMRERLNNLSQEYLAHVESASVDTISGILDQLGTKDKQVTMYVLNGKIDQIIRECVDCNNQSVDSRIKAFNANFARQDEIMRGALSKGASMLSKVNVSGTHVKAVRDMFFGNYKFKPWGAIKLGENITKTLGRVGIGVSIAMEVYDLYKAKKIQEELIKTKNELKNQINTIFSNLEKSFSDEDLFYKNFAPSYLELVKILLERRTDLTKLQESLNENKVFTSKLKDWMQDVQIEDVEFEEITEEF